jgi:hypothetical protein
MTPCLGHRFGRCSHKTLIVFGHDISALYVSLYILEYPENSLRWTALYSIKK